MPHFSLPPHPRTLQHLILAITACALLALTPSAHAAKKNKKSTHTSQQVTKKHHTKVKPSQNHSGETTAERERRLTRECRGMPNAGACLGYARP